MINASDTLGRAIVAELEQDGAHEVVRIDRTQGKQQLGITNADNMATPFGRLGHVETIVSIAGSLFFGPLAEMTATDFNVGLQDKLLGRVHLVLIDQHYLNDGGSTILTTDIIGQKSIAQGAHVTIVNADVECLVRVTACELPRSIHTNAISPAVLIGSMETYSPFFRDFEPVSATRGTLACQGQCGRRARRPNLSRGMNAPGS